MVNRKDAKFARAYKSYVGEILHPTHVQAKAFFRSWKEEGDWDKYAEHHDLQASPSPIQRVQSRIKRVESVIDKIARRPDVFSEGLDKKCFVKMKDTYGVRIILYFLAHFPVIDKELRALAESGVIEISTEDPPKAYLSEELVERYRLSHLERSEKESGYASIHYIVRFTSKASNRKSECPWFEIQVRTLAEDTWGEIEHLLGYKPNRQTTFAVKKQFQIISRHLAAIDEHFNFLFEELSRFQIEGLSRSDDDELNAENLPALLRELDLSCSQHEIHSSIKILRSRQINTIGELRSLSQNTKEIIRRIYALETGAPPNNHQTIATMAYLSGHNDPTVQESRIRDWISISKIWDELKNEDL